MRTMIAFTARIVLAAATLGSPIGSKAQEAANGVVANIPFAFQIGSYQLPAGKYKVQEQDNNLLWIKGDSGSAVMLVMTESANKPSTNSAIVFHHYGNKYFLREVRTAGNQQVLWSTETKAEHRAKIELAANSPNSGPREDSKVEVALLTPLR